MHHYHVDYYTKRTPECLRCLKVFKSTGPGNLICPACNKKNRNETEALRTPRELIDCMTSIWASHEPERDNTFTNEM